MHKEVVIDHEFIGKKFSNEVNMYLATINHIENKLKPINLLFMSDEEFLKIKSIKDMQYIYWLEMIERLFIASITTLLRNKKWFNSVLISILNHNFYAFSSSLRYLLESCADSYFTLKNIPDTLCETFAHIKKSLQCEAQKVVLIEDLENLLIHYSHALKLTTSERRIYPDEFSAKQVREYLDCIKHENEDVIILYSKLCQISHPSSISLMPYLFENEKGLILHNRFDDQLFIDELLSSYKESIITTFSRPTLLSLISLKLINMLDYKELCICEKELSFLDDIGVMESYLKKIHS